MAMYGHMTTHMKQLLSLIDRLKLSRKITFIVALPLILLSFTVIELIYIKHQQYSDAKQITQSISLAQHLEDIAHHFAVERGLSAGFLASKGKNGRSALVAQRKKAEQKAIALSHYQKQQQLEPKINARVSELLKQLSQRASVREKVDKIQANNGAFKYYSQLNAEALNIIQSIALNVKTPELSTEISAYNALLWLKEKSGQERGALNAYFTAPVANINKITTIHQYIAEQEIQTKQFFILANRDSKKLFKDKLKAIPPQYIQFQKQFLKHSVKMQFITQLQSTLGYGGLIHHFQQYLQLGSASSYKKIQADIKRAESLLNEYLAASSTSDFESQQLKVIAQQLKVYAQATQKVKQLYAYGLDSQDVLKNIKLDDGQALAAIALLSSSSGLEAKLWFKLATQRIGLIKSVVDQARDNLQANANRALQSAWQMLVFLSLATALFITLIAGVAIYIAKRLINNIQHIAQTISQVERNSDYSLRCQINSKDETGDISQAFNRMLNSQQSAFDEVNQVMNAVGQGQYDQTVEGQYSGQLKILKEAINHSVSSIGSAINDINNVMEAFNLGSFSIRINAELNGELNTLKSNMNSSLDKLEEALSAIMLVASQQKNGELSQRIEQDFVGELAMIKTALNDSGHSISTAVAEITQVMSALKEGDFSQRIQSDFKGELHELKLDINDSLDNLNQAMQQIIGVATAQTKGDLKQRVSGEFKGELGRLKNIINDSGDSLDLVVSEISSVMSSLKEGNFSQRLEHEYQGDFQKLKENTNASLNNLSEAMSNIVKVADSQSQGDLSQRVSGEFLGELQALKLAINDSAEQLEQAIISIRASAKSVHTSAKEIAIGNTDLSQRTEEQAASLEETAASMEEMTAALEQSTVNSKSAKELSANAKQIAMEGSNIASQAMNAMSGINDSSKKVADIIGVIDEIAFQTNLLALNAAVEAARAGEQGRGFAVVAREVRSLAQRSAKAAKQISNLISDSRDKVTEGTNLINEVGDTLEEIVQSSGNVAESVEDISQSAQEQHEGISQVNIAINQMDNMTQQNAALVEQASAASESMAGQANNMLQQVAFFKVSDAETEADKY